MIIGAGLAGLVAAHAFPREPVVEAMAQPRAMHRALLRFRSAAVGELCGIEFRPVTVRKGIWYADAYRPPDIQLANLYARKVVGQLVDRSIWSLEPVTRWVAPEDLYEQLVTAVGRRVEWGVRAAFDRDAGPLISTAPMPVTLRACGVSGDGISFARASITVARYRVPGAAVYQTTYFPSPEHTLYRASITGDLLICEFVGTPEGAWADEMHAALALPTRTEALGEVAQEYGKITPIDEGRRKALIVELTEKHGVFSLGRFATWRNILLDDVMHDIAVIKRLLKASTYERKLIGT